MLAYLKRLVTAGAAYQAGDLLSKAFALFTLPLYTRFVAPAAYGAAETLLTSVILASILLRLGVGEAFVRFHFDDEDRGRRDRLAAGTVGFVALSTSAAAIPALLLAGPLSRALLGFEDPWLLRIAVLGLWAFTNLEVAYSLLRVEERAGTYLRASIVNVVVSVAATAFLVVSQHQGARGILGGNFIGTTLVLLGLWWSERARLLEPLRARSATSAGTPRTLPLARMLAFGLPTVPADAAVYALQVVDRAYIYRVQSPAAAGLYAISVKLATVVFVAVRGFQYAWPPLAYSVADDAEAARLYSLVTTYYALATGIVVAGVTLVGRWLVRVLDPSYFGAHAALPWLALGWALYGLYLVFVVIAGRARMTGRILPAAALGLAVNVGGLVVLVPAWGIAGAGIALCAAYAAMIAATYALTRRVFAVGFEWARLARLVIVLGGVATAGELLLPTHGLAGFLLRCAAFAAIAPLLAATRFFQPREVAAARRLLGRLRGARA